MTRAGIGMGAAKLKFHRVGRPLGRSAAVRAILVSLCL